MAHFFADTSFLVALEDTKDENHSVANGIFSELANRSLIHNFEEFCITDYVVTEVFHLLQKKIGFQNVVKYYEKNLRECQIIKASYPDTIERAIKFKLKPFCNRKSGNPNMGLVDATSLIVMEDIGIPYMISFDDHFVSLTLIRTINRIESVEGIWNIKAKQSPPKSLRPIQKKKQ